MAGQSAMEDVVYIRNYEDVDGTSAMQIGEDQCCVYIAEKDQFFGRECCNAKQRERCV